MKLKDVPVANAYVVCHDCFDNGAMDVWPSSSIELAKAIADRKQDDADANGYDSVLWRSYVKLPRKRVFKYHPQELN